MSRDTAGALEPRPRRGRGWTLIELVVSVVLIASVLIVAVGMIPMGVTALRKAENLQAATLYGLEVIEDASRRDFDPAPTNRKTDVNVQINETSFRVQRFIYSLDGEPPHLYDVIVLVSWKPQPSPVELKTRVFHP